MLIEMVKFVGVDHWDDIPIIRFAFCKTTVTLQEDLIMIALLNSSPIYVQTVLMQKWLFKLIPTCQLVKDFY